MNLKTKCPEELAIDLLPRSVCAVQCTAVLSDAFGIHSWGWNSSGVTGMGEHAEAHCLRRANRKRLAESVLYIAAQRKRNGKTVTARPCEDCQRLLHGLHGVYYRDANGLWLRL